MINQNTAMPTPSMGTGNNMGMPTPPNQQAVNPGLSPDQKADLTEKVNQIQMQMDKAKANKFAGDTNVEITRKKMLGEVFKQFQSAGVNLSDRNSVAKFIMNLQEAAPELAEMFEKSMETLLGPVDDQSKQPQQ